MSKCTINALFSQLQCNNHILKIARQCAIYNHHSKKKHRKIDLPPERGKKKDKGIVFRQIRFEEPGREKTFEKRSFSPPRTPPLFSKPFSAQCFCKVCKSIVPLKDIEKEKLPVQGTEHFSNWLYTIKFRLYVELKTAQNRRGIMEKKVITAELLAAIRQ